MEEQKKGKAKMIEMTGSKAEEPRKRLTYEQLNDACNQLWQQNRQLMVKNKELEQLVMNKRLDYLFKVIENSDKFKSVFVVECTNEIEEALGVSQEENSGKE